MYINRCWRPKIYIDKYGWLVPVKSPKELANKINLASEEYFLNESEWENRRFNSRNHVISKFTLNNMVKKYINIWES